MKIAFKRFLQHTRYIQMMFFASFLVGGFFLLVQPTQANDSSVVTIFADGTERTISTGAKDVAEALEKAQVNIDDKDLVEPTLDTQIVDNVYRINVYRARPVIVIDGNKRETVVSPYQSARLIASEAGVTVYPEDNFTLERVDDILSAGSLGQRLTIDRAKVVYLNLYGEKLKLRTQAETVKQLLEEKGIELVKGETLRPKQNTPISQDMSVFIAKVGTKIITKEVEVPFEEEIIQDSSLPIGTRQVREAGTLGRKSVTYEVVLTNGKETGRKKLHEVVIRQPSKQIVVVGTQGLSGGPSAEELAALRQCESGGNYSTNTGNGFYGAYQFMIGTWDSIAQLAGRSDLVGVRPDLASPSDQDAMVIKNWLVSGPGQWPSCTAQMGY